MARSDINLLGVAVYVVAATVGYTELGSAAVETPPLAIDPRFALVVAIVASIGRYAMAPPSRAWALPKRLTMLFAIWAADGALLDLAVESEIHDIRLWLPFRRVGKESW